MRVVVAVLLAVLAAPAASQLCCDEFFWSNCYDHDGAGQAGKACAAQKGVATGKGTRSGLAWDWNFCGLAWQSRFECGHMCNCRTCAAGTYVSTKPSTFVDRKCTACPAGKFSSTTNVDSCTNFVTCAANTIYDKLPSAVFGGTCALTPCAPGLEPDASRSRCVDINECSRTHLCAVDRSVCVNTQGSYECQCHLGFEVGPGQRIGTPSQVCAPQGVLAPVDATNSALSINTSSVKNSNLGFTKYQLTLRRWDDSKTIATNLAGYPKDILPGNLVIPLLPSGVSYQVNLVPYTSAGLQLAQITTQTVTTKCGCDFTTFNGADESTGMPSPFSVFQQFGQMRFSWGDKSLCEEAFAFFRQPTATAASDLGTSFTDDFFYTSSTQCDRRHMPDFIRDDLATLALGESYRYCVQAVSSSNYASAPACVVATVQWEARVLGSVLLSASAGGLPVHDVQIDWAIEAADGGSVTGSTMTNAQGQFEIHIVSNLLVEKDQVLTINVSRVSGYNEHVVQHRFLCDGVLPCDHKQLTVQHLSFDNKVVFIDDTMVPFSGSVLIANTEHDEFPLGCPLEGAEVCLKNHLAEDLVVSCTRTDAYGRYVLPVAIGLTVYVDVVFTNASHTFVRAEYEPDGPNAPSGWFTPTDMQPGQARHFYTVNDADAWEKVDFVDTTSLEVHMEVVGGLCNRSLGAASFVALRPSCPTWQKRFDFDDYLGRAVLPAHTLDIQLAQVSRGGQPRPEVTGYFSALLGSRRSQSLNLEDPMAPRTQRTARFVFHPRPTLSLSFRSAGGVECNGPLVLRRDMITEATVLIREEFGDDIMPCDIMDPEFRLQIDNQLGESPKTVDKINATGDHALSNDELELLRVCFGGCNRTVEHTFNGQVSRNAHVTLPLMTGEPNLLDNADPTLRFTKAFTVTATVAPHAPVVLAARVIVTGSKIVSDKFSVPFPRYNPLLTVYDPPGGLSFAEYENYQFTLSVKVDQVRSWSGLYSDVTAGVVMDQEVSTCLGAFIGMACKHKMVKVMGNAGVHATSESLDVEIDPVDHTWESTYHVTTSFRSSDQAETAGADSDMLLVPALNVVFLEVDTISFNDTTCMATKSTGTEWSLQSGKNQLMFDWVSVSAVHGKELPTLQALLAEVADVDTDEARAKAKQLTAAIHAWEGNLARIDNVKQMARAGSLGKVQTLEASAAADPTLTHDRVTVGLVPQVLQDQARLEDGRVASDADKAVLRSVSAFKFSGGGSTYDFVYHQGSTAERTFGTESETNGNVGLTSSFEATVLGLGAQLDADGGTASRLVVTATTDVVRGVETERHFTLGDADPGDMFDVEVYIDPLFGTFIFNTVAGASLCPAEEGTYARESLGLSLVSSPASPVMPDQRAVYQVMLENHGKEDVDVFFMVAQTTNMDGLTVYFNGAPVSEPILIEHLPPGGSKYTVEIARGPLAYEYPPVKLELASACERERFADIYGYLQHKELAKVTVPVAFQQPCSRVEMAGDTLRSRVVNATDVATGSDSLTVLAFNPDHTVQPWASNKRLESVRLEYRPAGSQSWLSVPSNARLAENSFGYATLALDVRPLQDGEYEIRLRAVCTPSSGQSVPGMDESSTDVALLLVDREAPTQFELAQPADGVFFPKGDVMSFSFSEPILCVKPYTFDFRLEVDQVTRALGKSNMPTLCHGRTVSMLLPPDLGYGELMGRNARLMLWGVADPARNRLGGVLTHTFSFAAISIDQASVLVTGVTLRIPFQPDFGDTGSAAFAQLSSSVSELLASALSVNPSRFVLVSASPALADTLTLVNVRFQPPPGPAGRRRTVIEPSASILASQFQLLPATNASLLVNNGNAAAVLEPIEPPVGSGSSCSSEPATAGGLDKHDRTTIAAVAVGLLIHFALVVALELGVAQWLRNRLRNRHNLITPTDSHAAESIVFNRDLADSQF